MTVRFLPILCALASCVEFRLDPIEPDVDSARLVVVTDRFVQAAKPQLDLLLVVDRTSSMSQEHEALVTAADGITGALDAADVSWQAGVVSLIGTGAEAGLLLGSPWILTPSDPPLSTHLASVLSQPDLGREEAGIAAALQALDKSEAGGPNQGFRREGASLHVVFVSDTDDESDDWLAGDPVTLLLERLSTEALSGGTAQVSAMVGDVPSGCVSTGGSALAGTRYAEAAVATSGAVSSICLGDYAAVTASLAEVEAVLQASFALSQSPVDEQIYVQVDGQPSPPTDWAVDTGALVFEVAPPGGSQIEVTYVVEVGG